MQVNVGIVEDEPFYLEQLKSNIKRWQTENYCQVNINSFSSCQSLISYKRKNLDIIFMDIQLPDGTGVELAKTLRKADFTGQLVFLTAFKEYVFEGYQVHALNYLLKPVQYDDVRECLNTVYSTLNDENYIYRYRDTFIKIPYYHILYLSSSNHKVAISTIDKCTYWQSDSLNNIIKYLPTQFQQCHRTTIVNMHHVMQIRGKELELSNRNVIPISDPYLKTIRSAFVAQAQKGRKL